MKKIAVVSLGEEYMDCGNCYEDVAIKLAYHITNFEEISDDEYRLLKQQQSIDKDFLVVESIEDQRGFIFNTINKRLEYCKQKKIKEENDKKIREEKEKIAKEKREIKKKEKELKKLQELKDKYKNE